MKYNDKKVYIFGDKHTGYENICVEECVGHKCIKAIDVFNHFIDKNIDVVDIFLELAYDIHYIIELATNNKKVISDYNDAIGVEKKTDKNSKNVMNEIFHYFMDCAKSKHMCPKNIRLHRADYRQSPEVSTIIYSIPVTKMIVDDYIRFINQDPGSVDRAANIIREVMEGNSNYSIGVIIDKTKDLFGENFKEFVDRYMVSYAKRLDRQMENPAYRKTIDILNLLKQKYDQIRNALYLIDKSKLYYMSTSDIKEAKKNVYSDIGLKLDPLLTTLNKVSMFLGRINMFFLFAGGAQLMDKYLLGRLTRVYKDGTYAKNSIIYTGYNHSVAYIEYLTSIGYRTVFNWKGEGNREKCCKLPINYEDFITFHV